MGNYRLILLLAFFSILVGYLVLKPFTNKLKKVLFSSLLLLLVLFLYLVFGGFFALQEHKIKVEKQKAAEVLLKKIKGVDELIDKLSAHLDMNPNSARGWYLLGRVYASQNMQKKALEAFTAAYKLAPDDELITINFAKFSLMFGDENGVILLKNILMKNPLQMDALSILAMDAYAKNNHQEAIFYWRQLLRLIPSKSEEAVEIRKAIARASL